MDSYSQAPRLQDSRRQSVTVPAASSRLSGLTRHKISATEEREGERTYPPLAILGRPVVALKLIRRDTSWRMNDTEGLTSGRFDILGNSGAIVRRGAITRFNGGRDLASLQQVRPLLLRPPPSLTR